MAEGVKIIHFKEQSVVAFKGGPNWSETPKVLNSDAERLV